MLIPFWVILAVLAFLNRCESPNPGLQIPGDTARIPGFPAFITPVQDYFQTRIGGVPEIKGDTFRLRITGAVDNPSEFSLEELKGLEMVERTLTVECIGNPVNGSQLGTAEWKGFQVYELLESLGLQEGAGVIKYRCADGYFTYNTLDELKNSGVIAALYMNGDPIPPAQGFPLRILFPGYFGVRQPCWIQEMEVMKSKDDDYWTRRGWNTDAPTSVDSKIFFPLNNAKFTPGDSIRVGGTAYGSRRIGKVEITPDDGDTWIQATLKQGLDQDYVWVFWEAFFTPQSAGRITIRSRATSGRGEIQPGSDNNYLDGTDAWPSVTITVE